MVHLEYHFSLQISAVALPIQLLLCLLQRRIHISFAGHAFPKRLTQDFLLPAFILIGLYSVLASFVYSRIQIFALKAVLIYRFHRTVHVGSICSDAMIRAPSAPAANRINSHASSFCCEARQTAISVWITASSFRCSAVQTGALTAPQRKRKRPASASVRR